MRIVKKLVAADLNKLAKGDVLVNQDKEEFLFLRQNHNYVLRERKNGQCKSFSEQDILNNFKKVFDYTDWRKDSEYPHGEYKTNRKDIIYRCGNVTIKTSCHPDDIFDLQTGLALARHRWVAVNKEKVEKMQLNSENIVGKQFGDYKVTELHGYDSANNIIWALKDTSNKKPDIYLTHSKALELVNNINDNEDYELPDNVSYEDIEESILTAPCYYHVVYSIANDFIPHSSLTNSIAFYYPPFRLEQQNIILNRYHLNIGDIYPIYNTVALITNKACHKPTLNSLKTCLNNLVSYCLENEISYLAFPHICCGRGNLNWNEIKKLILKTFGEAYENANKLVNIRFYG